jgi:hypothetical protein
MKYFDELTEKQQEAAVEYWLRDLLTAILEGYLTFDDEKNGDGLQARIDGAIAEAERMQTPWFAHEYIMDVAREDLEAMARTDAAACTYLEDEDMPYVAIRMLDKIAKEA